MINKGFMPGLRRDPALFGWKGQLVDKPTRSAATDTAALRAAYDALPSTGGMILLQEGTYRFDPFTFAKQIRLVGCGKADPNWTTSGTLIESDSSTADLFTLAQHGCSIESLAIRNVAASTPTAGSAIKVTAGDGMRLLDLSIRSFYRNIDVEDGAEWVMDGCHLLDPVLDGMLIRHVDLPDGGDMVISNCQFISGPVNSSPGSGVRWESGGGLKIVGSKFNYRNSIKFTNSLALLVADGVTTSVIIVNGCSLENANTGILIGLAGTTGNLDKIIITGNEIVSLNSGSGNPMAVIGASGHTINRIVISGNHIQSVSGRVGIYLTQCDLVNIGVNNIVTSATHVFQDTGATNVTVTAS